MRLDSLESESILQETQLEPQNRRFWYFSFLLALVIHLFFFFYQFQWGRESVTPRVEIQQVDPAKLAAIRKSWHDKALLLGKTKSDEKVLAPEDARYISDRNIRVKKEQRARDTNVVPKSGRAGPTPDEATVKTPQSGASSHRAEMLKSLGNLGIPMKLTSTQPDLKEEGEKQPLPNEAGGDQAILDKQLPVGSENMLNAQESIYYSFYSRIYEAVAPLWQSEARPIPSRRHLAVGDYKTVIDVVFDAAGNLIAIHRLQSSGVADLDMAAEHCWRKIARFPNPPQGLLNSNGEVHIGWTFTVEVDEGSRLNYLPPERNY